MFSFSDVFFFSNVFSFFLACCFLFFLWNGKSLYVQCHFQTVRTPFILFFLMCVFVLMCFLLYVVFFFYVLFFLMCFFSDVFFLISSFFSGVLFSDLVHSFGVLDRCFLKSVFMECFHG